MEQEEKPLHIETSKERVIWEFTALIGGIFFVPYSLILLIQAVSDDNTNYWQLTRAIVQLCFGIQCLRRKWK